MLTQSIASTAYHEPARRDATPRNAMTELEHLRQRAHSSAAYTQAQIDGYVYISDAADDNLIEQWESWCAMYTLPMIQVREQHNGVMVSVDLSFCVRSLSLVEQNWLQRWWELSEPFSDAACELAPQYCVFPNLRRPQALALAQCVLALVQGPPLA